MKIYDTLSGKEQDLPKNRTIKIFVCGPTVYDYPHIGNARTIVFFDMFTRYLRSQHIKVDYLQNITDIDDKIIQRAKDDGVDWRDVSKKYEKVYFDNIKSLGVDIENTKFARATDYIKEIITQVKRLKDTGHAYLIEGDGWYFDITKYSGYGELAHRTVQQAEDGMSRIDNSDKKKNAGDFCLWKLSDDPSLQLGDDGLGAGRPGWHIEDTAITEKFFGPQYDIHGGAVDLKFPHHEAERAQQESASGKKPFVNIWMHTGFLTVGGQKMSKSLGNFITVDDVLQKMTANEFRMMLLMHHYRKPLDFTEERVKSAKVSLAQIQELLWELSQSHSQNANATMENEFTADQQKFDEFINDDFDTYKAFGLAMGVLVSQTHIARGSLNPEQARKISAFLIKTFSSFGITLSPPKIPENIQKLVQNREGELKLSKVSKQFIKPDALRKEIEELGYVVEDTPAGPLVLPKS